MKTKLKIPFLSIGLGALVFAGFAGSISGSLAWWAYSTRASIGYHGTSVTSSEQLQIGIKTGSGPGSVNLSSFGMVQSGDYYFCDAGAGLHADVIAYFLKQQGQYAVDELIPVTSGSYTEGDTFRLKDSLVAGTNYNDNNAEKSKYVRIPLAFRVLRYDSDNHLVPAKGENIWLSETVVEASSIYDGEVYKAIRMFTRGKHETMDGDDIITDPDTVRLINPSSNSETMGKTAVAGLLDISGSGYYDTHEVNNEQYAIIYGESNLTDEQLLATETIKETSANPGIVDFNETGQDTERSTFVSRYEQDTYHPNELADISPKYQNFDTLGTLKAKDIHNNGDLTDGKPVCQTSYSTGIADLDLTIWLEGWDHNVVDKENQHSFNLGLQFMISRL